MSPRLRYNGGEWFSYPERVDPTRPKMQWYIMFDRAYALMAKNYNDDGGEFQNPRQISWPK
jgi:hypothetical protein